MHKLILAFSIGLLLIYPGGSQATHDGSFSSLSVSQTSVFLAPGQSTTVTVFPHGNVAVNIYYVSNTAVVNAFMSGNILQLNGSQVGAATVRVCTFDNHCADIAVTVSGSGSGGGVGSISLSPSSLSINVGQSSSVNIFGGNLAYYVSSNSNPNAASASIAGSNLWVNALNAGFTNIGVCSSGSSNCGSIGVSVGANTNQISLNPAVVNLSPNQSQTVAILGGHAQYFISSNSNPNVVSVQVFGNNLNLQAVNPGQSSVRVCAIGSSNCATVSVITGSGGGNFGNVYFITTTLNDAPVNSFYSAQLLVGGTPPFNFTVFNSVLPSGLTLSSSGLMSGTPTAAGSHTFTVAVTDALNRSVYHTFFLNTTGSGQVLGAFLYNNGTLINDAGTIWITYKNTKAGFANMAAFRGLGYPLSSVITASAAALTNTGFVISRSDAAHPWGSWIKSGPVIYFVHETGLIPISRYDIFISNGGRDHLVVAANVADLARSILPLLNSNDPRLR